MNVSNETAVATAASELLLLSTTTTTTTTTAATSFENDSLAAAAIADTTCPYSTPMYLTARFWLVAVFGTLTASLSAGGNLFLFVVLCKKKQHRNSHILYLLLLAAFDTFIALSYIPLMSLSVLADFAESPQLLDSWYMWMRPLIVFSHISMTTSTFLIVAASFERFCLTCCAPSTARLVNNSRRAIAGCAMAFGFLAKFTLYFEFEVEHKDHCKGTMGENELKASELARNFVTIFVPFFCLLFMNMKIIHKLRAGDDEPLVKCKPSEVERKGRIRAATRSLICVVFTYLLANVLSVVLAFWEYADIRSLTEDYLTFYLFSVDAVSIMTCLAACLRPVIYNICMPAIRKDFLSSLKSVTGNRKRAHKVLDEQTYDISDRTPRTLPPIVRHPSVSPLSAAAKRLSSSASVSSSMLDRRNNNNNEEVCL